MNRTLTSRILSWTLLFAILLSACGGSDASQDTTYDTVGNNDTNNGPAISVDPGYDIVEAPAEEQNRADTEYQDDSYADPAYDKDNAQSPSDQAGGGAYQEPQSAGATGAESEEGGEAYYPPSPTQSAYDDAYEEPVEDPYGNTTFQDYGTNPFVDTDFDRLSTFAMDVDTGSYTVSRGYLRDGFIPPSDAVRVEEFVNFFDQGYPQPRNGQAFGINLDGGPTPFTNGPEYQMIRVGIQGIEIDKYERDPLVLTFVIDVSGSMEQGGRLELVKDALAMLVDQLDKEDTVTIIAYSDTAWVVLRPTAGNRADRILDAINELRPTNSTNAEAGLITGYKMAYRAFDKNAANRVILLSDGVANVGETGPGSIWEEIEQFADRGITLTSVGVGMGNYNDVLLEQLADQGNGFYAYIDSYAEAERLFVEDIMGTLQVIALDAKVQVSFNPDVVERYRLLGYENRDIADEDFDNPNVDAGEVGSGHSVTALYEIKLYPWAEGELATVTLHWEEPGTGRLLEIDETLYVEELADSFRGTDPYFQWSVLVAAYAENLRHSYWAEQISVDQIVRYSYDVMEQMAYDENVYELVELMEFSAWRLD